MTTSVTSRPAEALDAPRTKSMLSRTMSFAKAEMRMLLRNRTALINVALMPFILIGAWAATGALSDNGMPIANAVLTMSAVMGLGYISYYNLVTTYVARRESYVLKRMRSGPVSDLGVIVATSLPSVVLSLAQIVIIVTVLAIAGFPVSLVSIVPILLALVIGTVAFAGLAIMSTGFTRTAELAQITTLPIAIGTLLLSGLTFPLTTLPDIAQRVIQLTPGAAVVDLFNLGLGGINRAGELVSGTDLLIEASRPGGILAFWAILGVWYLRRHFRWEPRR